MRQNANISVVDARYGTKAPFTYNSTLDLPGALLPPEAFVSIRVYCDEHTVPPVRLSRITRTSSDSYALHMADSANHTIGSVLCAQSHMDAPVWSVPILNDNGIIKGHVSYAADYYDVLLATLRALHSDVTLTDNVAVLLPFCLVSHIGCYIKTIDVGDGPSTSPVVLVPAACVHVTAQDSKQSRIDAGLPKKPERDAGICWLCVDNVDHIDGANTASGDDRCTSANRLWVGGHHLILRSGLTSNLRVITTPSAVSMEGVLDG